MPSIDIHFAVGIKVADMVLVQVSMTVQWVVIHHVLVVGTKRSRCRNFERLLRRILD